MRPVCKGFYAVFTIKSQVSSLQNLNMHFFGAFDFRETRKNGGISVGLGDHGARAPHRI